MSRSEHAADRSALKVVRTPLGFSIRCLVGRGDELGSLARLSVDPFVRAQIEKCRSTPGAAAALFRGGT